MADTLDYYNSNAQAFFDATFSVDMRKIYDEFLPHLPEGGHILDAGCGSARDALHFQGLGYRVSAFDGSEAIAKLASQETGLEVEQRLFSDVKEKAAYDGIWACASLLHLPKRDLLGAIQALWVALKPGGALYMSFKSGDGEREELGRHFTDVSEGIAEEWVNQLDKVDSQRLWHTEDALPERVHGWLNILLVKKEERHQKLITGGKYQHFLPKLCQSISQAHQIDFAVAFVKKTGLNLIYPDLQNAISADELKRPANIRILTSDYLDITDPEALRILLLLKHQGADVRVYESKGSSFHLKAYLFAGDDDRSRRWGRAFIGSSNISAQALQAGIEWNYQVDFPPDEGYLEAAQRFEELFESSKVVELSDQWVDDYEARRVPPPKAIAPGSDEAEAPPVPTPVQSEALTALDKTREEGFGRGLVVLATGLGKTWLSAFDAKQMGARRILFVAHREEILKQAAETYIRIRPKSRVGYYMGSVRNKSVDILCASVQTLGKEEHLREFDPRHFDYIVVDEFHHASAPTYHRLLDYFAPHFLLGLTATPDRTDRSDILSLCDDNLVYEFPLLDGVKEKHLVPFHYYGIFDESVDYTEIPWRNGKFDPALLGNKLATLARARHALRVWRQHRQTRTLAFCVSRKHADFMAEQFDKAGIPAASVHGDSTMSRGEALELLNNGELQVVFSVDLFNEGVDLPSIDTVLLLRPTESKVLFLQQIGRGLRKSPGKEKLVVMDFVGNHHSFLHKPQALMGESMTHRQLADFARRAESDELKMPDGCFVNYDLKLIEFLKRLASSGIEDEYLSLKETLGRRPTLTEYYRFGASVSRMRKQHGSWFDLVRVMEDLSPAQNELFQSHKALLSEVETTAMSKSFKMILLEAFMQMDGWRKAPSLEALSSVSWSVLQRRPRLFSEISDAVRDVTGESAEWFRYWKKNPIDHWINKKPALFKISDGCFESCIPLSNGEYETLSEMVREVVEYRLASYEARSSVQQLPDASNSAAPNAKFGVELPYFSSLKIACGHFRNSQAESEEYRSLGGGYGRLDPSRHFIARASGNSMNGGKSPIHDGDYLLLEYVTPNNAGSITEKTFAIERLDEAGDTQYLLRMVKKRGQGDYYLRAANPDYEDIEVSPELNDQIRTFARLKSVVSPLDMAVGQRLMREEIPPLFGEAYNPGNWQSGHVCLNDAAVHVLLVTLNKQGKAEDHRYVDHWIDESTFHWQSQRSVAPEHKKGREIINHKELGISVHLFVRENKLENGKAAPFTYYGTVDYQKHEGSKPMSVVFKLAAVVE
ncbi:DUF3427 domain-containing protein [Alcanivorax sp. S6407]|uniref:DUF3427 domain-containing protein n=1 Tax=Alcanivorax sp. S6407 TaxID=2926424 RepID=UPI001FF45152|nr:DUF3427 domain-containing protein [Alcanivorax sp. S6407]MCK0154031.1 DUF3427 domain-containing protein [Alcanivorax sp. S6407]